MPSGGWRNTKDNPSAPDMGEVIMNEKTYVELIGQILESVGNTIDEVKRCLFSRDKRRLTHAEKAFASDLKSSLPLCEALIAKKEKLQADQEFLALLPSLQRLGIAGRRPVAGDTHYT